VAEAARQLHWAGVVTATRPDLQSLQECLATSLAEAGPK
jgi:hypothetical protein